MQLPRPSSKGPRSQNGSLLTRKWKQITLALIVICLFFIVVSHNNSSRAEIKKPVYIKKEVDPCSRAEIIPISWRPRIFLYKSFLSSEDIDYVMKLGDGKLTQSQVAGADGKDMASSIRKSSGVFIPTDADATIMRIEQAIAEWTMMPVEHGESFYLLRYQQGDFYNAHHDYFEADSKQIGDSGNRKATVIIYLQNAEEGGGTTFPEINKTVYPEAGDALLLYNINLNGTLDHMSLHSGDPVIAGEKWVLTKWLREKPYLYSWYANQQRLAAGIKTEADPNAINPFTGVRY